MSRPDIIRWVIERMMAHEDSITQDLALTVEREARAEWGGQRVDYISKTCAADRAARASNAAAAHAELLASSRTVQQIADHRGLSRRTLYRLMRKGPPGQESTS